MALAPEQPTESTLFAITAPDLFRELQDFSIVVGDPVFRLFRRSHVIGEHLEFLYRRLIMIISVTWLPLLLLTSFSSLFGHVIRVSFLHDIEAHVRFLVVLPILFAAELIVDSRMRPIVRQFVDLRVVFSADLPQFQRALESAIRMRDSIAIEILLLVVAYSFGLSLWHSWAALNGSTWYSISGSLWELTPAGWWYVFVSIPIFQFFLLRWYMRFFIWFRFLWHVSRLNLRLIPTHPDHSAGLAFLGKSAYAFGPILFAQGAMLAGVIARRVLYGGENLVSFKFLIAGFVGFFLVAILGPLVMFTPAMARAKREGLRKYGWLAQGYVESFEEKWIREPFASDELLGAADIQSLADLSNSYAIVREMRSVPFGLNDISRLAAVTAAPLLPLLLTIFSVEELFIRVFKTVF